MDIVDMSLDEKKGRYPPTLKSLCQLELHGRGGFIPFIFCIILY
jgi:hypothetical protein